MPHVEVQQSVSLPVVTVWTALREVLNEDKFVLRVDLGDIRLPDVGYVAVPVHVELGSERIETPRSLPLVIQALKSADAFPTFDGAIALESNGPSSSTMSLGGTYEPPMRRVGAFLDTTILSHLAERALGNFLRDIAQTVQKRGEQAEIQAVRHRIIDRGN